MENKNICVNLVYADGSERPATISASAIDFVTRTARMLPCLFEGTGFNPLNADVSNIIAVTRADHDILHQSYGGQRKADFRLGQMDMKASICDMLRDAADNAVDESRTGLIVAADLVETVEVPNANA